jgi:hypothetical protein
MAFLLKLFNLISVTVGKYPFNTVSKFFILSIMDGVSQGVNGFFLRSKFSHAGLIQSSSFSGNLNPFARAWL